MFYDTKECCLENVEFGKFLPEDSKVSKLGLWWDPFIQSKKCIRLKLREEPCVMTTHNDKKFEE